MLQLFPFLAWLAVAVSAVMTVMLWSAGDLGPIGLATATAVLLIAGYCQFLSGSAAVGAAGSALQTLLAIGLIVRWRLTAS